MAVTSSFPFKSVVYHTITTPPPPPPSSISSFESRLFGIRLCNPNFTRQDSLISLSTTTTSTTTLHTSITARYGGGGGGGGGSRSGGGGSRSGYDRNSRQSGGDDDQALDISSIRSVSVRLIDEHQNMVGVVTKSEAMRMAEDAELDLVILSPEADPPVLRIMDYNKYKYESQKKKRDQQKKNAANRMDLKELKMGYNIDSHDYSVRLRAAQKFLKDGDKVKIIVNLKGRENEFRNNAIELIKRFQSEIGELATEESKSFRERNMNIVLVPNKLIVQKSQDPVKKKENAAESEVSAGP